MSSFKCRLEKAEKEARQIQAQVALAKEGLVNRRLAEVRDGRFWPVGSVMASLNDKLNRQCLIATLDPLQSSYQEAVKQALAMCSFHSAKWLLQYLIMVGFEHYHMGAPLRIPDPVCDWLLAFDPIAYGYENDRYVHICATDLCYDCGICYPSIDPVLKREPGSSGWQEHPFVGLPCFDCSGAIRNGERRHINSPARGNNEGWRERCEGIKSIDLPESLRFEEWDWEEVIRKVFEGDDERA